MIGGSGFGQGRLAQEDVEELKQRRQDHGPQRQLTAVGSGSGQPLGRMSPLDPTPRLHYVVLRRQGGHNAQAAQKA